MKNEANAQPPSTYQPIETNTNVNIEQTITDQNQNIDIFWVLLMIVTNSSNMLTMPLFRYDTQTSP